VTLSLYPQRLGNEAFANKEFDDAIKHYSGAIKIDPKNHVYFSNRRYDV
jgi:cytochrome c-type biogenesis protein CcmH/NrfG